MFRNLGRPTAYDACLKYYSNHKKSLRLIRTLKAPVKVTLYINLEQKVNLLTCFIVCQRTYVECINFREIKKYEIKKK